MAPLYKRYIPPKSTTTTPAPSPKVSSKANATQASDQQNEPKKRKRERTEEEVAERKAKKLRKKGIDLATVVAQPYQQPSKDAGVLVPEIAPEKVNRDRDQADTANGARGEFAHVRSAKQRHKLEKEARNARKTAKKESKVNGTKEGENEEKPLDHGQGRGQGAIDKHVVTLEALQPEPGEDAETKKRKKRWKQDEPPGNADEPLEVPRDSRNTAKKSRTKKGKGSGTDVNGNEDDGTQTRQGKILEARQGDQEDDASLSQPKKRRHKLESVLRESSALNGEDHLEKHGSVLDKFRKSTKLPNSTSRPVTTQEKDEGSEPVLRDLVPLPQPEKAPIPEFEPDSSSLPRWLAKPMIVSSERKQSFEKLNLDHKTVQQLSKLGLSDALPVQQALIPLLLPPGTAGAQFLPGTESVLPDMAVSAPTGSGKTIAYLLPIIESLKKVAALGNIKTLVVVPTRELVMQIAAVAESLAKGSSIKVGMATGTGSFKDEQAKLVKLEGRYDPAGYRELMSKAHRRNYPPARDTEDFELYLRELEDQDMREEQRVRDAVGGLVDHVPVYHSAVDVLVVTPGRVLEHLSSTLGFSLAHLEWLVLDEADKLLDQQYDGFLQMINDEISRPRWDKEQDARECYLRSSGLWDERQERRARKVVLSATMTRDISKLVELKLKRPRLIVVRGGELDMSSADGGYASGEAARVRDSADDFELPPTLSEYSVPVGDGSEKPLFLVELLGTKILSTSGTAPMNDIARPNQDWPDQPDADSSASSDTCSDSSSDSESIDKSLKDTSDGDNDEDSIHSEPQEPSDGEVPVHPERAAMLDRIARRQQPPATPPTILIFTSSTESATRLSHLLKTLRPNWSPSILTLTKSTHDPKRPSTTKPTDPMIAISTDRASRGLDAVANRPITHVIQYDVPRSVTSYVHRVGRTARVGRRGEAWTLFTHSEARWFVTQVVNGKKIMRKEGVEKVRLTVDDWEEMRERLKEVVGGMREEVLGFHGRPK